MCERVFLYLFRVGTLESTVPVFAYIFSYIIMCTYVYVFYGILSRVHVCVCVCVCVLLLLLLNKYGCAQSYFIGFLPSEVALTL